MNSKLRKLLATVLLTLTALPLLGADLPYKNINTAEFEKLRADKNVVVLDVRTEAEFKAGHIPNAVNVDVNRHDFAQKMESLDKSKTYLVHCAAGRRSVTACEKLSKLNFPKLMNLEGGYRAWVKEAPPPAAKK